MGKETGIAWCDSTWGHWHGCTKIEGNYACKNCYAEAVNKRGGGSNWGFGAPRRLLSEHTRNDIHRWNRAAPKFMQEHGRRQRVFCSSMSDAFDNEVDKSWRDAMYADLEAASGLEIQILTKRISNVPKMVPESWKSGWPSHIGLMITVVTQAEADRDCPRLLRMKREFGIPWVGVSYEPAQEYIDFLPYLDGSSYEAALDWVIFGGKSGRNWNDGQFDANWARPIAEQCAWAGSAFFFKQVAAFRPTDDMIPADLMIRQWPAGH